MPTYTAPTTRATGYTVTAANWNAELVENFKYFKDAPVFDAAAIIGAASTAGIRLDLETGALAVREGDDSAYAPLITGALTISGALTASGMTITGALIPTTNDGGALGASGTAWSDLFLAAGGVVDFGAGDTTITHSAGKVTIAGSGAGALDVKGAILPTANDGAALGASGTAWADLFLASGGVLDFAASEATITHSATNTLSFGTSGSERLRITSGGNVAIAATAKLFLDGVAATGNTYLQEVSADTIVAFTNGSERLRIGSTGRVGIGTTSPDFLLDVAQSTNGTVATFGIEGQTINPRLRIEADESTNTVGFNPNYSGATSPALVFKTQESERLRITSGGDLAIGATAKLYLDGTAATGDTYLHESSANNLSMVTGGTERLRLTSSGDTAIPATAKLFLDGVAGTGNTYLQEIAGDTVVLFTNGSERLRVDSSGNLGLGTTAPGVPFDMAADGPIEFRQTRYTTGVAGAVNTLRKARGTQASPTAVATGDNIGLINFTAYGGTNYSNIATIRTTITTYTSDTSMTSHLSILTTSASNTATERLRVTGGGNLAIGATARLLLDDVTGAGDTYLTESSANTMSFFTGGTERLRLTSGVDIGIAATAKIYLDGVAATGNTYIAESTADTISLVTGGTERARFGGGTSAGMSIAALSRLYLDGVAGTGNTYISESSSDVINVVAGGSGVARFESANGCVLGGNAAGVSLQLSGTTVASTHSAGLTIGAGTGSISPTAGTVRGAIVGAFTNVTGVALNIEAGNGTGTGGSGSVIIRTAPAAASSSTANTMTDRVTVTSAGNVGIGTATFGTSAAGVLSIASGTEPTTGPADTVQIYSVDRSAGNTIPAIYCEGTGVTNAGITSTTVTHKIALKVNGTVYYLLATTNAT